ncbi:hypothetical protein [Vibrio nigripulchritudo]|uniref:hypothetical protein n=1 Tax=Vibrio nigripulchritudo TaxID=28173 RepID=UPI00190C7DCE|nr:hypothetical protein [Vibrio nigripulchritudo]
MATDCSIRFEFNLCYLDNDRINVLSSLTNQNILASRMQKRYRDRKQVDMAPTDRLLDHATVFKTIEV